MKKIWKGFLKMLNWPLMGFIVVCLVIGYLIHLGIGDTW